MQHEEAGSPKLQIASIYHDEKLFNHCKVVVSVVVQRIKVEMESISSHHHDYILLDTTEAVKPFSMKIATHEVQNIIPTLMHLVIKPVTNPKETPHQPQ